MEKVKLKNNSENRDEQGRLIVAENVKIVFNALIEVE